MTDETRITHWSDHTNWRMLERKSYKRIRRILKGEKVGPFALGGEKSAEIMKNL